METHTILPPEGVGGYYYYSDASELDPHYVDPESLRTLKRRMCLISSSSSSSIADDEHNFRFLSFSHTRSLMGVCFRTFGVNI